jgi:hypothetical protein
MPDISKNKMPIGASIPFFETHYETAEERKKYKKKPAGYSALLLP